MYEICDTEVACATATVRVQVGATNDPPVINEDKGHTTPEDTPLVIDVLANDVDIEGLDPSTLSLPASVTNAASTSVVANKINFVPDLNYNGVVNFVYRVCDLAGACDTADVQVTVTPVNDLPIALDDTASTAEDTTVLIDVLANDSDVEGLDTSSLRLLNTPLANATASVVINGKISFVPNGNYHGVTTFTYEICDTEPVCTTAVVRVQVGATNDPPVVNEDKGHTTPEDTPLVIDVLANDVDIEGIDPNTLSLPASVINAGSTSVVANKINFVPDLNYNGVVNFVYRVCDLAGACDTADVQVTVTPVNDLPIALDDTASTAEDTATTIDVLANDFDVEGLDASTLSIPAGTVANATGTSVLNGRITFVPDTNYHGVTTFTYKICDAELACTTATVRVTVGATNDPPVINNDSGYTTPEDTPLVIDVLANDVDIEGLDPSTLSLPGAVSNAGGTSAQAGKINFVPNLNYNGVVNFVYRVCDLAGSCDTASVQVTVTPVNDLPVAVDDAKSTAEDTPITIDVLANDYDVEGLDSTTLSLLNTPLVNATSSFVRSGKIEFAPNANYHGVTTFTYKVCDTALACTTGTVRVQVGAQNDLPVLNNDAATTPEDTPVTIDVLGNDFDVEGLDVASLSLPSPVTNAAATAVAAGKINFVPDANYNGVLTFLYRVCDLAGACDTASVQVTVTAVNDLPTAVDDAAATPEDTPITIDVLANDVDIEGLDANSLSLPQTVVNATATSVSNGKISFVPNANYHGVTTFTYKVCDTNAACATATVRVHVGALNDVPVLNNDAATTPEDTPITIDVLGNDFDVEGLDVASLSLPSAVTNAIGTGVTGGKISFVPDANYNGVLTFLYRVCDLAGACDTASVQVTVTPVNDLPTANDDFASTNEDTQITIDVLANDADVEGLDPSSLAFLSLPVVNATRSDISGGQVKFIPDLDYYGIVKFQYRVCDFDLACVVAHVTVTVDSVNDPPTVDTGVSVDVKIGILTSYKGIHVTDPDITATDILTLTLDMTSSNATFNLGNVNGIQVLLGDGNADSFYRARGTLSQVNALLATFEVFTSFVGSGAQLVVTADDHGQNGALTTTNSTTATLDVNGIFFQIPDAPKIVAFVADDPDDLDLVYSAEDTMYIAFDVDTDQSGTLTTSELNSLFTFSTPLVSATGQWVTKKELIITVVSADGVTAPKINQLEVTSTGNRIKNIYQNSSEVTTSSFVLQGDWGQRRGPKLVRAVADDPDDMDSVYSGNDTITLYFSEGTDQSGNLGASQVTSLLRFNQGVDQVSGTWFNASILVLTVVRADNAAPPSIGVFTIAVNGGIMRDSARSSGYTSQHEQDAVKVEGDWGKMAGPTIISVVASDPDNLDALFSDNDVVTIHFSSPTNMPNINSTARVDSVFAFSESLGSSYSGRWATPQQAIITIANSTKTDPTTGPRTPLPFWNIDGTAKPGTMTVSIRSRLAITSPSGHTLASTAPSPTIIGDWGQARGPKLLAVVMDDPDDADAIFGQGDVVDLTFDVETNQPNFTTHAQLTAAVTFWKDNSIVKALDGTPTLLQDQGLSPLTLGRQVVGEWRSSRDLRVTIVDSTGASFIPQLSQQFLVRIKGYVLKKTLDTLPADTTSRDAINATTLGNWGLLPGPNITSIIADDPDDADDFYSDGDTITLTFGEPMGHQPDISTKEGVDMLLSSSESLGTNYTGEYLSSQELKITILNATGHGNPQIGVFRVQVRKEGNVTNVAGLSLASVALSPPINGDWGLGSAAAIGNGDIDRVNDLGIGECRTFWCLYWWLLVLATISTIVGCAMLYAWKGKMLQLMEYMRERRERALEAKESKRNDIETPLVTPKKGLPALLSSSVVTPVKKPKTALPALKSPTGVAPPKPTATSAVPPPLPVTKAPVKALPSLVPKPNQAVAALPTLPTIKAKAGVAAAPPAVARLRNGPVRRLSSVDPTSAERWRQIRDSLGITPEETEVVEAPPASMSPRPDAHSAAVMSKRKRTLTLSRVPPPLNAKMRGHLQQGPRRGTLVGPNGVVIPPPPGTAGGAVPPPPGGLNSPVTNSGRALPAILASVRPSATNETVAAPPSTPTPTSTASPRGLGLLSSRVSRYRGARITPELAQSKLDDNEGASHAVMPPPPRGVRGVPPPPMRGARIPPPPAARQQSSGPRVPLPLPAELSTADLGDSNADILSQRGSVDSVDELLNSLQGIASEPEEELIVPPKPVSSRRKRKKKARRMTTTESVLASARGAPEIALDETADVNIVDTPRTVADETSVAALIGIQPEPAAASLDSDLSSPKTGSRRKRKVKRRMTNTEAVLASARGIADVEL